MTRFGNIRALFFACAAMLALTLVGCGGGGASSTGAGTGGGGGTTSSAGITIALKDPVTGAARTSIAPDSDAVAEATVRDASGNPVAGVAVTFTAGTGYSTFFPTAGTALTNSSGVASISLAAGSVTGADTLTAKATVAGVELTGTTGYSSTAASVASTSSSAGSIRYVSASPTTIAIKGAGGVNTSEVSTVIFRVFDTNGNPIANRNVSFRLNTSVGGVTLAPTTATTAADGSVQTIVNSGTVATAVRVTASVVGSSPLIEAISEQLVVSTGIPHNNGFTIAASTLNIEGFNVDGTPTTITARLSDHFGNLVPDGTAVSFRTEGGVSSITPSCTTIKGACSVTLTSSGARPANGRLTILATAVGEETYVDTNGNGIYDSGDGFTEDLAEAFVDNNENGTFDAGEEFVDFNSNGVRDGADGQFNGVLRASGLTGSTTINVRSSLTIVLSGSTPVVTLFNPATGAVVSEINFQPPAFTACSTGNPWTKPSMTLGVRVVDGRGQLLPAGTTVVFTTSNGKITSIPTTFSVENSSKWPSPTLSPPPPPPFHTSYGQASVSLEPDVTQSTDAALTCSTNTNTTGTFLVAVTLPGVPSLGIPPSTYNVPFSVKD